MDFVVLGSGSSGNSCFLKAGGRCLLIDAGLSTKQLEARTAAAGFDPCEISAVFLTHEHHDHTTGLKTLLKRRPLEVFCNAATARALGGSEKFPQATFRIFQTGAPFEWGPLSVLPFSVPHDAAEPVGFRIQEGNMSLGILTDLGYVTNLVTSSLRNVTCLLIEANYDEQLLQNDTKRPWSVKQRIASRHGHLSNRAAAEMLSQLEATSLEVVVLAHLSRDCNSPELAIRAATEALASTRPHAGIHCANQAGLPGTPQITL